MKNKLRFLILILLAVLSQKVFTQTVHTVEVNNFSFNPAQLTIKVGDTVKWTNILGFHSVVADDNSFGSGAASSSAWVYEFVFNTPGTFRYYCGIHGAPNGVGMSGIITVDPATDVNDENFSIYKFDLQQNYPNPFNPSTKISYTIPSNVKSEMSNVVLKIYDVIGNEVATLVNEQKPAGNYEVNFSAAQLSSGIYFYKLQAGSLVETKKMILLR